MSRFMRIAVLASALLSLLGVISSAAGAVTWDNSGNTAFNATSGPGTLSSTATSLACVKADVRGVTTTPATGAVARIVTATLTWTGCSISGQQWGSHCSIDLTAAAQTLPVTHVVADMTCAWYLGANKACHFEGQITATYTNPSGATAGVLSMGTSSLRSTPGTVPCLLGNHDVDLSPLTFRVTSGTGGSGTLGPIITRTA